MANARPADSTETISRDSRQLMLLGPVHGAGYYPGYRQIPSFRPAAVGQPPLNEVESRIGFALLLLLLNGLDDRFASTQQPVPNPPMANFPMFPMLWPQVVNRPRML